MKTLKTATKLHIQSAKQIYYTPRNTSYHILHHNVQIKSPCGEWLTGCVYQDIVSDVIYTRPYSMFNMDKWVVYR